MKSNTTKIYGLISGQCTDAIHLVIKGEGKYGNNTDTNDTI